MELVDQRSDADWLRTKYAASQRRVCGLMGIAVASYRYRTRRSDEPLRAQLVELAREAALRVSAAACFARSLGRAGESQAGASRVSRGRVDAAPEEAETLCTRGQAARG